jgi:small subunit ribosomal protein S15
MLTSRKKKGILKTHGRHEADTGSSEVQVAILTKRIEELTDHLRTHRKDHGSRRGLIGLVSKRKKLLKYLESSDKKTFNKHDY